MPTPPNPTDPELDALLRRPVGYPQPVVVNVTQAAPVRQPRHLLHLALTVVTGGAWGIVWLVVTIRASRRG